MPRLANQSRHRFAQNLARDRLRVAYCSLSRIKKCFLPSVYWLREITPAREETQHIRPA